MGQSYYHRMNICPECGRFDEHHIGKASAGWEFIFQGLKYIKSYADWLEVLEKGGEIRADFSRQVTLEEFKAMVERHKGGRNLARELADDYHYWLDAEGHPFSKYDFS